MTLLPAAWNASFLAMTKMTPSLRGTPDPSLRGTPNPSLRGTPDPSLRGAPATWQSIAALHRHLDRFAPRDDGPAGINGLVTAEFAGIATSLSLLAMTGQLRDTACQATVLLWFLLWKGFIQLTRQIDKPFLDWVFSALARVRDDVWRGPESHQGHGWRPCCIDRDDSIK